MYESSHTKEKKESKKMETIWKDILEESEPGKFEYQGMIFKKRKDGTLNLVRSKSDRPEISVPEGVSGIGYEAFGDSKIQSLKLPNSLSIIGPKAFFRCENLKEIEFGKKPVQIGLLAFFHCSALEFLDLKNVFKIGIAAFFGCENLHSVKLHPGLSVIDRYAFKNCHRLKEIALPSSLKTLKPMSLGNVEDVFLERAKIPFGLFSSVADGDMPISLRIHAGKSSLVVPRHIDERTDLASAEKQAEKILAKDHKNVVLYHLAASIKEQQQIALEEFRLNRNPELKNFLSEQYLDMMTKKTTEEDFLSFFLEFRDNGLLKENATREAFYFARDKGWTQATAYVMEELKMYGFENPDFRL